MSRGLRGEWRRLTRGGRLAFLIAVVLNPVFKLVVAKRGIAAGRAMAERVGGSKSLAVASGYDVHRARRIATGVHLAARLPPVDVVCLPRSLTLWALLRRLRVPAELVFGVEDPAGQFAAHAWVRVHGVDVGEDAAQIARYQVFGEPVLGERLVPADAG